MLDLFTNNSPVGAIIAFFIVLIPLIIVHELGHFIAARSVGIAILEFGLGFPPRMARLFRWKETEFTLNWLPLGGFVRPLGEDAIKPVEGETLEKDREELARHQPANANYKAVHEAKPLQRIWFMSAGALANFLLAILLFAIVGLIGFPQVVGAISYIAEVQPDSLAANAGLEVGDVILRVNDGYFQNSIAMFNIWQESAEPVSLLVQRGGTELTVTAELPAQSATGDMPERVVITGIVPESPAETAGIRPGDLVTGFNGDPVTSVDSFIEQTRAQAGEEVTLTLSRQGERVQVALTPRVNPPEGQGAMGIGIRAALENAGIGITAFDAGGQEVNQALNLGESLIFGVNRAFSVIDTTIRIPSMLISGAVTAEEARPVSVVGMSQIGAQIIEQSIQQQTITPVLNFIAIISVALGFFNLLPIPALDGGRILFVIIEIIRGKPMSPEREGVVHLIGLAILLSLSVFIILNDFINPINLFGQ
jgi:regulator of sigma E protease